MAPLTLPTLLSKKVNFRLLSSRDFSRQDEIISGRVEKELQLISEKLNTIAKLARTVTKYPRPNRYFEWELGKGGK